VPSQHTTSRFIVMSPPRRPAMIVSPLYQS